MSRGINTRWYGRLAIGVYIFMGVALTYCAFASWAESWMLSVAFGVLALVSYGVVGVLLWASVNGRLKP